MDPSQKKLLKIGATSAALYAAYSWIDSRLGLSGDLTLVRRMGALQKELAAIAANKTTVVDFWYETLRRVPPNKDAVVFEDAVVTFAQLESMSNKIANWAVSKGLKPGQSVALNMENRPEFIVAWLGLAKAGLVIAFINHNIKLKPLVHSVVAGEATAVVFGCEVAEAMAEVAGDLAAHNIALFSWTGAWGVSSGPAAVAVEGAVAIDDVWGSLPDTPVDKSLREGRGGLGVFGFIYTSGTTGLPKACRITHLKYASYSSMLPVAMEGQSDDRIYTVLPLYHTAGGGLGVGALIKYGCTLILRRKFSASLFWEDCAKYNATAVQYIGELCRYLLMTPPSRFDTAHHVRIAYGNGLRPEIWDEFQRRFNVPMVGEFYGATEGNGALINLCKNYQGQGAVGKAGILARRGRGIRLVKFDVNTEMPIRNAAGLCEECDYDEAGELLFRLSDDPMARFEGYTDKGATEKKILRDVFVKGDAYFRTGDLLRMDKNCYFYFVDRIGDTFRWQGENVSTMEVSEALSSHPAVQEANVYGVQVPGKDGRACMVALVLQEGRSLKHAELAKYVRKQLPKYAIPMFVRFLPQADVTGTFKHKKVELREEGYDPAKVQDRMWYFSGGSYHDLDADAFRKITTVQAKL